MKIAPLRTVLPGILSLALCLGTTELRAKAPEPILDVEIDHPILLLREQPTELDDANARSRRRPLKPLLRPRQRLSRRPIRAGTRRPCALPP